jgi:NADH-quinone oxidoreductase subunit A
METGLLPVLVFVGVIAGFVFVALFLGRFFRPPVRHTPLKDASYECGEEPVRGAWFNFNPRFYLIALVFVVFDVEVALVFPVAAVLRDRTALGAGGVALAEIALFVVILLAALAYLWLRGDLRWIKDLRRW